MNRTYKSAVMFKLSLLAALTTLALVIAFLL